MRGYGYNVAKEKRQTARRDFFMTTTITMKFSIFVRSPFFVAFCGHNKKSLHMDLVSLSVFISGFFSLLIEMINLELSRMRNEGDDIV